MLKAIKEHKQSFLLLVLAFFPIYKPALMSITIIVFVLFSIIFWFRENKNLNFKTISTKWFFITTGFYIWIVIAILYSEHINLGLKSLQSSISLFIIPFVLFFFTENISKKTVRYINLSFVTACALLAIYIHAYLFYKGVYTDYKTTTFWQSPIRETLAINPFKDLHPTYISLWFFYCIIYLIDRLLTNFKKNKPIVVLPLLVLFLISTVLLSSRIAFIAFIVALLSYFLFSIKNRKVKIVAISFLITSTIVLIMSFSTLKSRFVDEFKVTELKPPVEEVHNSLNIRVGIYNCTIDLIKQHWLLGLGSGNVQKNLNNCYSNYNTDVYKKTDYNTHNQYFHVFLASGIIGLLLFLVAFFFQLQLAIRTQNFLYLSFLILLFVSFLSENILVRINGVFFYVLFNSLFIKQCIQRQKT